MSEEMVEEVRRCLDDVGGDVIDCAREWCTVFGDCDWPSHRKADGSNIVCDRKVGVV